MEIISEKSGRTYVVAEAMEPREQKTEDSSKKKTYDILVIFDWNSDEESPEIVNYIFGAGFLEESMEAIHEIIEKYEHRKGFI